MIRIRRVTWAKDQKQWAVTRDRPPLMVMHESVARAVSAYRDYRRAVRERQKTTV